MQKLSLYCILTGALFFAGCSFRSELPPGALVSCTSEADCPASGRCHPLGYCVQPNVLFKTVTLTPDMLGPRETVRIQLEAQRLLTQPVSVRAVFRGGKTDATSELQTDSTVDATWQVPVDTEKSGLSSGEKVLLLADLGLEGQHQVELGTVDVTPPVLTIQSLILTPPSELLVEVPGAVVYSRISKGTLEEPSLVRFSVAAKAGAFEPKALIIVSAVGGVVKRVRADALGGLPSTDLPLEEDVKTVKLQVVDAAGNVSEQVPCGTSRPPC
jgi:hypothetical protein